MITLIEAKDFRCLRYIHQPLGPFHVLVGPNASGKTTFLDVVAFLGALVSDGLEAAIEERTQNFQDLLWGRTGSGFELALEAAIPDEKRDALRDKGYDTVRYEIALGIDTDTKENVISTEKVLLKKSSDAPLDTVLKEMFPEILFPPETIITSSKTRGTQTVLNKVPGGNDNFYSEVYQEKGKGWTPSFKLGPRKSALGNLPEDESKFPVATWLKTLLADGIQRFVLNSMLLRKASPPGQVRGFKPDGSNLPWVVDNLKKQDPGNFQKWIEHLQTALPDLEAIDTIELPDTRHRYLSIYYSGGLRVPSWMVSDGTLRLLALTLPAYLKGFKGIYLIEEPENGIHPRAIETIFQSLSSIYDAQVLVATHSPVILGIARAEEILCFAKTPEGATDIVLGSKHPALKEWQGEIGLGTLFAGGVLG
ncbi:MAG: ATP-binding protein [Desulfobacteraceae bacterium]|nr:ATP-binding protein [Desulfobacteraceae bacterium]